MEQVETDSEAISANLNSVINNLKRGSERYRAANADICQSEIESTRNVIKCIDEVSSLDENELVGSPPNADFYKIQC